MSHNGGSYHPAQTSGGAWQQPGYSGPPQKQGPAYPAQHLIPCFPQNQLPPQNQGPCYRPQNQILPFHPQNQGPHIPPLNQTPLFPPQNQCPPFPPQNQGSMCPPQNQRPMFSAQNQGPRFPPQNQNNGPWFPQNNSPSFAPYNQSPAYPQHNDDWESLEKCPDDEKGCEDFGEDLSNQNDKYDEDWNNQNYDHEEDWRSQPPNPSSNDGFKRGAPCVVRGRRHGFSNKGLKRNDFKEAPLSKRPQMGPKTNSYQYFNQCSKKQFSNNILVNIVQTSEQLNRPQDKYKENSRQRSKQGPVLLSNGLEDGKQSQLIQNTSTKHSKEVKKHDYVDPKLNDSCSLELNYSLLQCNNEDLPEKNKVQAKDELGNTTSNLSSTLNQKKYPLNNHGKPWSQITNNVQREKLRRTNKRLNPQNDSTPDDNTTISTKRAKTSDKALSKEKQHSTSKLVAVDTVIKSKPKMQDKIKGTSSLDDRVKMNDTMMDKISISQPTDKLEPTLKIKIGNIKTEPDDSIIKAGDGKNQDITNNVKNTEALANEMIDHAEINCEVLAHTNASEICSTAPDSSRNINDRVKMNDIMMDKISISQLTDKLEATLKIKIENIQTEPDDSIIKADDGKNQESTNNVKNKEALANEMIDHAEISCAVLAQNDTNASEICSIAPDSSRNINEEQLQINFNESTVIDDQSLNDDSQNSSDFYKGIKPLEANLEELYVIDEVEGSDDAEGNQSIISSGESELVASDAGEHDVHIDDIDAMQEEGLPTNQKDTENQANKKLIHKVVLNEIGQDNFDVLPEDWIQITHNSGMPVYLHKESRVCTMSRPYFLGPGSARSHKTPLSAIPCLQYKQTLELEEKYEGENRKKQATTVSEQANTNRPPLLPVVSAKIETAEENEAAQSLDPTELQEYCKKVFNFKTISSIPFKTWGDRRKFDRMTKDLKKKQSPLLPSGAKLLRFPIHNPDGTISKSKGEWEINLDGKNFVCILLEYARHAFRQCPKYQFKELKNPATPYSATVYIGEMQYGTGMGSSKKKAKLEAAKEALEVLIPNMEDKIERVSEFAMHSGITQMSRNYENSIFDQILIEDPRVAEFCVKTTKPLPYTILETCLQRNGMGLDEVKVEYNMNTKIHKEDEFKMTVRNHVAVVLCKNKRDGKQKAAQAILKALHPKIEHFGTMLRMYGNHSINSVKENKQEEQEITGLHYKAAVNRPQLNYVLIDQLKASMLKLAKDQKERQDRGSILPTASTSRINL